jgi:hypothetical protein
MYVKSGDLGGYLMKRLCQPPINGSVDQPLSTLRRNYHADFLSEKLISFLKSYHIKRPFLLGLHFAIRTECALGCNLRRKLNLSQFIVPTGKYFGCATEVLSATKHHLLTLRAVSVAQPTYRHIHLL